MLNTIEAIYDPKDGLKFTEAVDIDQPVKVLVTIIEPLLPAIKPQKGSAQALSFAMDALPIPDSEQFSDNEIEEQIIEARESWE